MGTDPDKARLDSLSARLNEAKADHKDSRAAPSQGNRAMSYGLRIGVELVAAVLVGAGMGWMLDRWFGTGPWLLILFFMFGVAAGFRNALRASEQMAGTDENETDSR